MQERIKQLEQSRSRHAVEAEDTLNSVTCKLELELKEKDDQLIKEVTELQQRSEEQLSQMKNFYEIEKEKVELRVNEEKERSNKRISQI